MMNNFSKLLNATHILFSSDQDLESVNILGVSMDSRHVMEGDCFVCCAIAPENIQNYTSQAISKGACAVILNGDIGQFKTQFPGTVFVQTENPRLMVAHLAAAFYHHHPHIMTAVTGTNGKSSVVSILRQIFQGTGVQAASLGTLGLESNVSIESVKNGALTTLDPISLHKNLDKLAKSHVQAIAFEASSHGLDQYRLHGVKLTAAAFTNFTQDHLDYHKTMESYFHAKMKLFSEVLPKDACAVINRDMDVFDECRDVILKRSQKLVTFGTHFDKKPDFLAQNIQFFESHMTFDLHAYGDVFENVHVKLFGAFQIENILCAIALAHVCGVDIKKIIVNIPNVHNVAGRMELMGIAPSGGHVFVDYAHTPDALKSALQALKHHTKNHLHVVFGCGGDRDASKRPLMGEIAAQFADYAIVTDDNPRFENPDAIRANIIDACPDAQNIGDRKRAIEEGIKNLMKGDVLLIAGKGHEKGQIVSGETLPFDDRVEVKRILKACV